MNTIILSLLFLRTKYLESSNYSYITLCKELLAEAIQGNNNEVTIVLGLISHFSISNESANRVQKIIENIYNKIFVKGLCDKTIDSNIYLSDVRWK